MKSSVPSTAHEPVAVATELHRLGAGPGYHWRVNARHVDMTAQPSPPLPLTFRAEPQMVTMDLQRTAMIVIDMQNDFCAKGGGSTTLLLPAWETGRDVSTVMNHLFSELGMVEIPPEAADDEAERPARGAGKRRP